MKSISKNLIFLLIAVVLVGSCSLQGFGANDYDVSTDESFNEIIDNFEENPLDEILAKLSDDKAADAEIYDLLKDKGLDEGYLDGLSDTLLEKLSEKLSNAEILDVTYEIDTFPILSEVENTSFVTINVQTDKGRVLCVYWRESVIKSSSSSEHYVHLEWDEEDLLYMPDSFYAEDYGKNGEVSDSYTTLADIKQDSIGHFGGTGAGAMVFTLEARSPGGEANDYLEIHYLSESNSTFTILAFLILTVIIVLLLAYVIRIKKKAKKG